MTEQNPAASSLSIIQLTHGLPLPITEGMHRVSVVPELSLTGRSILWTRGGKIYKVSVWGEFPEALNGLATLKQWAIANLPNGWD